MRIGKADPDLAIHQEAMMQVDNRLSGSCSRPRSALVLLGAEAMNTEKIAIRRFDDVLFRNVALDSA